MGSPAKSSRLALGALILKERLGVTDRELVEQIAENPYLQYFLGLTAYQHEAPFHHSLLTTFRKRFTHASLGTINEAIAQLIADAQRTPDAPTHPDRDDEQGTRESPPPKGQLLLDATCVPADIKYPTDLNLLNDAREKTEAIIDRLHLCRTRPKPKPRTYRQNARRAYLRVAKARKAGEEETSKGDWPAAPVSPAQSPIDCHHGPRRAARHLTRQAIPPAPGYSGTLPTTTLDVHAALSAHRQSAGESQSASRPAHCARQSRDARRIWREDLGESGGRGQLCGSDQLGGVQRIPGFGATDRRVSSSVWA